MSVYAVRSISQSFVASVYKPTSFRLNTVKIKPVWEINLQSNGIKECTILLQYGFSLVSISHRENIAVAPCDFKRKDFSVYFKGQSLAKKAAQWVVLSFFVNLIV